MLELYNVDSTHGAIIALLLDAKELDFVGHTDKNPYATEFTNEVTLKDGDHTVHGTYLVATYINEKFPYPDLQLETPLKRSIVSMLFRSVLLHYDGLAFDFNPFKEQLRHTFFLTGDKPTLIDIAIAAISPDDPYWDEFREKLYDALKLENNRGAL